MKSKPAILIACLAAVLIVFGGCAPSKESTAKAPPALTATAEELDAKPAVTLASYDAARAEAKKNGKLLLLKFEADWCGPCKDMTAAMKSDIVLHEEMKNYTVYPVDIDDPKNKDIAAKFYPDTGVPFVIVLRPEDESRVTDFVGFDTGAMLARELKAARDKA